MFRDWGWEEEGIGRFFEVLVYWYCGALVLVYFFRSWVARGRRSLEDWIGLLLLFWEVAFLFFRIFFFCIVLGENYLKEESV